MGGLVLPALVDDRVEDEELRIDDVASGHLAVLRADERGRLAEGSPGDDGIALSHVDAVHGVGGTAEQLHGRLDRAARIIRP